jgi:glycosyltransferase involved in cell wall biosynthesis
VTPYLIVTGDCVRTGGMDMANFAFAGHLAAHGHSVHLVTHRADEELSSKPNVTVHRVPKPANSYLLGSPLLDYKGRARASAIAGGGGRVLVNGGNCLWGDVNWVHYVHAAYRPESRGSALYGYRSALARRLALSSERTALRRARLVICNSERTKRDVVELLGVPEGRARVVYYGSDSERFAYVSAEARAEAKRELGWSSARPVVAFVGALSDRRKGFDTLYGAWREVCDGRDWDCDLAVIGEGAELPLWEKRAQADRLSGRIKFLGFRRDVPRVLAACDVLVHPARYEAYGLGVREALCCGLPALVSASAGVAEHYPAELECLLLPDSGDGRGLASRLRHWRINMEALVEKVSAFSALLRAHTWEAMSEQMVRAIEAAA